jgi:hypothetical protein
MGNILPSSGPVSAKSDTTNAGLDSTAAKGKKQKKGKSSFKKNRFIN